MMGMYSLLAEEMDRRVAELVTGGMSEAEASEAVAEEFEIDDPEPPAA
jgi:uncharacterized protein YoaH (UPF0181 family)